MRISCLIFIGVVFFSISLAQSSEKVKPSPTPIQNNFTFDDGCGDPMTESQIYVYRFGNVVRVTNDNRIIVQVTNSNNDWNSDYEDDTEGLNGPKLINAQIFTVSIVGIDESLNRQAIGRFLRLNLVGKNVTITGNTRKKKDRKIDALIRFTKNNELEDVSEYLLENGIAKFKAFQPTNLVPMTTSCELERAESRARKDKIGLWAKQ